jgi:teichuronic acid biosynthesis glycosyltransferase TuaG
MAGIPERPVVSAIVPMFNAGRYVRATLESLRAQTLSAWEAVVIDDGSTDDGPAIVAEMAAGDRRIKLYRQPNGGVAAARNAGLDRAVGEYVHFLDSDDLIEPGAYELLTGAARARGLEGGYGSFHIINEGGQRLLTQRRRESVVGLSEVLSYPHLQTVTHVIRRERVGDLRFDGRYPPYEDQHMWTQLAERGVRWAVIPEVVASYRIRPGSLSKAAGTALANSQRVIDLAFERARGKAESAGLAPQEMLERRWQQYALGYSTRAVVLASRSMTPGEAAAEGERLYERALGPKPASMQQWGRAGFWQVVYGLAIRPAMHRDSEAGFGLALRQFWARAGARGWISDQLSRGDLEPCWEAMFEHEVDPELIARRVVARCGGAGDVTLVGFGQNGRLLADVARAAGLRVRARDDRYPDGRIEGLGEGVGEAMDAPLGRGPVVLTPLEDGALAERFGAGAIRWSEVRLELLKEWRTGVLVG